MGRLYRNATVHSMLPVSRLSAIFGAEPRAIAEPAGTGGV